jgi:hypothetical protein
MQEVLNPLKSVSPVRAIDFSSNAKLEPRSARSDSFKKNGQNIESNKNLNQASKGKSPTNTQTANTQKLTKNTNSADETTNSEVDNFDKTLAKQSSTRKSTDNETAISKKELKEVTKEVLDALIAFIQQTQIAQAQQIAELKDSTTQQGFIISQDIDIMAVADTLATQNSLLQNYANEISLSSSEDGETITPITELVNQLLNSPELDGKAPELKALVLNEVISALSDKLEKMQSILNKEIENINISDISLENLTIDNETQLPKINPELEVKLDRIIKLGDKNEQLTKLLEVSSTLSEELNLQLKNINKSISDLGDDEKSIKTEIIQLLGDLDSDFKIEIKDFKEEGLGNDENISSIGLESIHIDQAPLNSDSQNKDSSLLFQKEVKLNHSHNPENINTAMKAAELVRTLPDLVRDTNPNSSRELKIKLNPEELGTVDVTISRNADQQISIQLSVTNEAAEETLKHKISELTAALGEKGISVNDINVSKSNSGNLNDKNREGQNSFNEGREEQKKRQEANQHQQNDRTKDQYSFQTELFSILR